jgi:sortase A
MNSGKRAIKDKKKFIRIAAIILCLAGFSILASQFYGDLYTIYKQRRLHQEWNSQSTRTNSTTTDRYTAGKQKNEDDRPGQNPEDNSVEKNNENKTSTQKQPATKNNEKPSGQKTPSDIPHQINHTRIKLGSPFARITIPKIKVDDIVVEGVDQEQLALGPGHMEETAWPGEYGNMVVSGHRVTHSRPFFRLDELKVGDSIVIYTKSQEFTYHVIEKKVVKPTNLNVIKPTRNRILTLTTCNPPYSAKTRLIIHAKMY